jgi:hypothetical protein
MRELSLHILDIVENGIQAGASLIRISVNENLGADRLEIVISDNGRGMPEQKLGRLSDPFVTSRTTRRVGLGLSLLLAATQRCEGELTVRTDPGRGTDVRATFRHSHIDRAPLGDMAATVGTLIVGNPGVDFVYRHSVDEEEFVMDTRELRDAEQSVDLADPVIVHGLTGLIREALKKLSPERFSSP